MVNQDEEVKDEGDNSKLEQWQGKMIVDKPTNC